MLTAILLAVLELNLQQQNTVKLAEILLQRNWSSKQLFCYSEKTVKKAAISLAANFFVAECFGFNLGDNT